MNKIFTKNLTTLNVYSWNTFTQLLSNIGVLRMASTDYFTDEQIVDLLDSDRDWGLGPLSYYIMESTSDYDGMEASSFSPTTDYQRNVIRETMALWDDLIVANFTEVSNISDANIKFGNSSEHVSFAHAYYPGDTNVSGTVWFSTNFDEADGVNNLMTPKKYSFGYLTYMHEIGHALGLSHPGNYSSPNLNYDEHAAFYQDSQMFTVMSYFSEFYTGGFWKRFNGTLDGVNLSKPQTPMMHDILAIQSIYGADQTTRSDDTTYGFNTTLEGHYVYDFSINQRPILTLYDAGGEDTLDLSGWIGKSKINMNGGEFSSSFYLRKNIAIAHGTIIENLVTGEGSTIVTGNEAGNRVIALGGDDTIKGEAGDDYISAGNGRNRILGGRGDDILESGDGNDFIQGAGGKDVIYGGAGQDKIFGKKGNDQIHGDLGHDTLRGGGGSDTFHFNGGVSTDFDFILDFEKGRDKIEIDGSYYEDIRSEADIGGVVRLKILENSTAVFLERSDDSPLGCVKIAEISNEGVSIEMDITDFIFTGF